MSQLIRGTNHHLFWFLFLININAAFAVNLHIADDATYFVDIEIFEIPGHGELMLEVPRVWNYNYTKADELTPPLITFYVLDQNKREIFQLNMSVLTNRSYKDDITTIDYVHALVFEAGSNTLQHSDQDELLMQKLTGQQGNGFFFELSDSNAGREEFKFLTQGALAVGEVLLVFSLFSNDEQSILRDALLTSIKSAKHINQEDI